MSPFEQSLIGIVAISISACAIVVAWSLTHCILCWIPAYCRFRRIDGADGRLVTALVAVLGMFFVLGYFVGGWIR